MPKYVITLTEMGTALGLLAGLGQVLPLDSKLSDLYLEFRQFLKAFFNTFNSRKDKSWGTVYDSVTKRPLGPAIVTALGEAGEVESAITDLAGRYSLHLPAQSGATTHSYTLQVDRANYIFPSTKLAGKSNDLFYNNLYFGGKIATREGDLITRDIPVDPVAFDWAKFSSNKKSLYSSFKRRELLRTIIFKAFFILGISCSIINAYFNPTTYNFQILIAFALIYGLQKFVSLRHRPSTLTDEKAGEPLSFAIAHLYDAKSNVERKRVIADEVGRFFMLVSPGTYYLVVDIRQPDGWYHSVKQNGIIHLRHGILPKKVRVRDTGISFADEY
jgi:hypothetical protein